jgi:hypothetical protein
LPSSKPTRFRSIGRRRATILGKLRTLMGGERASRKSRRGFVAGFKTPIVAGGVSARGAALHDSGIPMSSALR